MPPTEPPTKEESSPIEKENNYFCRPCDYRDSGETSKCQARHKEIFVGRDMCHWCEIKGVHATYVSKDYIVIRGCIPFSRSEEDKIMAAVERIKKDASRPGQ